jgi:2-polyprenyl-3-methyl-5-hydroxy-6-metoxy-1,4-benzoquinol methylase
VVDEYLASNLANWDERAGVHAVSSDYAVDRFVTDPAFISNVVSFDRARLGDLEGLVGVHLQCHIGTDTISLARLGASMTGLDFSPQSLGHARALAERTATDVRFVQADVYDALNALQPGSFDLVYTGIGALCWLPDIGRWATVVAGLLRPGGRLFIRDMHPMLGTLIARDGIVRVEDPYFHQVKPMIFNEGGTYVEHNHVFTATLTHVWSHGLGEIIAALLGAGMQVTELVEHDSVPWRALKDVMTSDADGEWRLTDRPDRLAASFTLQAERK